MLPLPPHLTTSLRKVYLQKFLLPSRSFVAIKKKITKHTKRQKNPTKPKQKNPPPFEEPKQASESDSDMADMLELTDLEFKRAVIKMPQAQPHRNRE